jgi:hypothetical protein
VDGTERRSGQGDEDLRVLDDAGVDPLAAADAGGDELPGVGLVEAGARRADGGPPVLARNEEFTLGQFPGGAVQGDATEPDRIRAQAGLVDFGEDTPPMGGAAHRDRRISASEVSPAMASSSR